MHTGDLGAPPPLTAGRRPYGIFIWPPIAALVLFTVLLSGLLWQNPKEQESSQQLAVDSSPSSPIHDRKPSAELISPPCEPKTFAPKSQAEEIDTRLTEPQQAKTPPTTTEATPDSLSSQVAPIDEKVDSSGTKLKEPGTEFAADVTEGSQRPEERIIDDGHSSNEEKERVLTESEERGLKFLLASQNSDGGWGENRTNSKRRKPSDVANTSMAALALLKATKSKGGERFRKPLLRAIKFLGRTVMRSGEDTIFVNGQHGTQVQRKIGQYADTFLVALLFAELQGESLGANVKPSLDAAHDKVLRKIEAHYKRNRSFEGNRGWASVLSSGLASKALNLAHRNGKDLNRNLLVEDFRDAYRMVSTPADNVVLTVASSKRKPSHFDNSRRSRPSPKRDAGISLYSVSANMSRLDAFVEANKEQKEKLLAELSSKSLPSSKRTELNRQVAEIDAANLACEDSFSQLQTKLADTSFLRGYGNKGGEEYLSYSNISEALAARSGEASDGYLQDIARTVLRSQKIDGSWAGQHCISGRNFCTSAALLALHWSSPNPNDTPRQ